MRRGALGGVPAPGQLAGERHREAAAMGGWKLSEALPFRVADAARRECAGRGAPELAAVSAPCPRARFPSHATFASRTIPACAHPHLDPAVRRGSAGLSPASPDLSIARTDLAWAVTPRMVRWNRAPGARASSGRGCRCLLRTGSARRQPRDHREKEDPARDQYHTGRPTSAKKIPITHAQAKRCSATRVNQTKLLHLLRVSSDRLERVDRLVLGAWYWTPA